MPWRNGYIPESDLVVFRRGRNVTDGDWFWGLTPATYARHLALVERARERTGRTLETSDGWGTYRPYAAQVIARRIYGNGAAVPGTSSHGGFWEGRETLAVDYSNWSWVYGGDRAAFYADCRAVGLTPGMIEPSRGYPDEPWHVIDENPRSGPGPASNGAQPFPQTVETVAPIPPEEDDMPTHIRSTIGESLAIGGVVVRFPTPEDVAATKIAAGASMQVMDTSAAVHTSIIAADERRDVKAAALPIVVYADGGDGTVYVWEDGRLRALADPATLHDLLDRGATSVHWSAAEVASLLAQQKS